MATVFGRFFCWRRSCTVAAVNGSEMPMKAPIHKPRRAAPERRVRDALAMKYPGCRVEVPCSTGVADIVTENEVIEVKRDRQWKSAMGQVLSYTADFPGKTPRVHLFGTDTDHFLVARVTCERFGVRLTSEEAENHNSKPRGRK